MALTRVVRERILLIVVCVLVSAVVFFRRFELPEFRDGAGAAPGIVVISNVNTVGYPSPTHYFVVGKMVGGNESFDIERKDDVVEFVDSVEKDGPLLVRREELDGEMHILDVSAASSVEVEDDRLKHHHAWLNKSRSSELGKSIDVLEDIGAIPFVAGQYGADMNKLSISHSHRSPVSSHARGLGYTQRVGDVSTVDKISSLKRMSRKRVSIAEINSIFRRAVVSSNIMRPKKHLSPRDRELLAAKVLIENAPIATKAVGLESSVFRNISQFKRSYDLMDKMLKVYIYKEGEKPVFHQPRRRGIYASEGWFMKLMEGSKQFVIRDPRKAHLFYLPFSSQMLRNTSDNQNPRSMKDLERFLGNFIDLIAGKYRFWNRAGGADHFFVACHDWASRITRQPMRNCIRSLCNANLARGFEIGKDTTLPVTYIKSAEDPVRDLGGKPPSERHILAFFAGGMHGYLRPILLHHWGDKSPDMKIFGPMPRDIDSKRMYRGYMKSSKYCICARGYEVHTPRVVEAIFYECVPVIISDNYVPPFFEVLDWETFAVFVSEEDVPNLRDILLGIPEKEYLRMQKSVKAVQQHFKWHKNPVKYDLFHMILHSVWHNRILQLRPR
ncbi:hypothetical protein MLD38_014333 [Melastoma candidum]|uniref:Uncharacterized protein n=1 Tax=Melastoma candidum TaxID=119954 RepID=A0ACB9RC24_9MYRT|nr:hypothetical protein MLD38_014333 [Melastoma candidum]